ncbi:DEAD/DEAH box helicase [uncultured Roseibium sp.]|uniref:DEAD/DEAH box helicase n=1 Tax=uncultured Roseibium sp. TaxID=1936171 RepID=UPI003217D314
MARLDEQRRALAMNLLFNRAAENELTPTQARLFVRSLQKSWQVPPIAWGERESHEQFDDARRLLHAAGIFREIDGEELPEALACYRRAAELLEWLARSSDPVTRDVPAALLAAGAYQQAGLPAMATSLLRLGDYGGGIAEIFAAFLSADFDRLLGKSAAFWADNAALTGRDGSAPILAADGEPEVESDEPADDEAAGAQARDDREPVVDRGFTSKFGWYLVVELVRSVGLIADALRRGNDNRLAQGIEMLASLSSLATRLTSDELWMLINLVEASAKRFAASSIHLRVARLTARAPHRQARMWQFAREQFARGRGTLWTSQVQGIERLIASDSFALCTPTGSGKTLVANLALVKELLLVDEQAGRAPLALYLVPSRALASEVEAKLTAELGSDFIVTGLYGGADWGITDYWLTADQRVVLIATVEKAEALMRYVGHLLVHRLRLLIIDEAHQVVSDDDANAQEALASHNSRAMRLEAMVSRLLAIQPDMARIALTAVAGGAARPVAQWIEGSMDATPVGLNYRSSRQLIGALRVDPRRAPEAVLDMMNGQILYVRGRDAPVYLPLRIPAMPLPAAIIRNSLPHYTQLYVLWTALHLREGNRRVLISVAQSPERLMKRYAEAFDLPGWQNVPQFEPPAEPDKLARFQETRAAAVDYCGIQSFEVRLLDRGIATSYGQMPQRLRRLMTDLIDRRICPLTLATATLTEGVNLPFDIIFLTSLERRSYDAEAGQPIVIPISTAEFRNLAGRAGRPGAAESIEGMILVALPEAVSTTAPRQRPDQLRQVQRATRSYDDLLARLQAEDAGGAVNSPLVVLLRSIWQKAAALLGLQTEEQFHAWLEATLPENAGANLGVSSRTPADQLGDSLDELDGFLLAASEELSRLEPEGIEGARVEVFLRDLWQRTFARVATADEEWLERTFIKRGQAFVERLYPDAQQRQRLYQYGFTPYIGRRFELVAPQLIAELQRAAEFGTWTTQQRFDLFTRLGDRVRAEPGIGFRVRDTVADQQVLANWRGVMSWWMQSPGAVAPDAEHLRTWQRFVSDNIEFKLGVAVGAAVAQAWGQNAGDLESPTLETWRAVTGLPWIGFWFRELIRWGTLDPFVAFSLAQGISQTRENAAALRPEFDAWLAQEELPRDAETLIDPQRYLAWQRSIQVRRDADEIVSESGAELTGVDGRRLSYDVRPVPRNGSIDWIDAAGFSVARSPYSADLLTGRPDRHDFTIQSQPEVIVKRTY